MYQRLKLEKCQQVYSWNWLYFVFTAATLFDPPASLTPLLVVVCFSFSQQLVKADAALQIWGLLRVSTHLGTSPSGSLWLHVN